MAKYTLLDKDGKVDCVKEITQEANLASQKAKYGDRLVPYVDPVPRKRRSAEVALDAPAQD